MNRTGIGIVVYVVCLLPPGTVTRGDTVRGIDIDFVPIGNAGNAADTQVMADGSTGYGTVSHDYYIGKYEVTNTQWDAFVAMAGAPTGSPANDYDRDAFFTGTQQPTNFVSWREALQFANYLTSGDKSKGVYHFSGNHENPDQFVNLIDRAGAEATYGDIYFVPSEDEWYKAAYFKSDGSGYSLYANGTDIAPTGVDTRYGTSSPWNVGTGTMEQNGTFDMMGNVWEWTDRHLTSPSKSPRGGDYNDSVSQLAATNQYNRFIERGGRENIGFRIASNIPEPTTLSLLALGGLGMLRRRSHDS